MLSNGTPQVLLEEGFRYTAKNLVGGVVMFFCCGGDFVSDARLFRSARERPVAKDKTGAPGQLQSRSTPYMSTLS